MGGNRGLLLSQHLRTFAKVQPRRKGRIDLESVFGQRGALMRQIFVGVALLVREAIDCFVVDRESALFKDAEARMIDFRQKKSEARFETLRQCFESFLVFSSKGRRSLLPDFQTHSRIFVSDEAHWRSHDPTITPLPFIVCRNYAGKTCRNDGLSLERNSVQALIGGTRLTTQLSLCHSSTVNQLTRGFELQTTRSFPPRKCTRMTLSCSL